VSAFRDLRILDFSQGMAGPMACMLMADFEAEVVKVEPPQGDRLKAHPGYVAWNRNKSIITLDIETAAGRTRARELIAQADVAVFDHAPGVLERLELDPTQLSAAHPGLVSVWMPPYGVRGRWSGLAPHHSLLTALSGDAFRQGACGDQPIHLVLPLLWYGQAVAGAAAIGAGLFERSQSGLGQAVTVSGLHGVAVMSLLMRMPGEPPQPRTHPQGSIPNYRLYQCADGNWLFLGTLFEGFFETAMQAMGLNVAWQELEASPDWVHEAIAEAFRTRSRQSWIEHLKAAGVPCAPVETRETWFASTTVTQSGLKVSFDHPERGKVSFPGAPVKLSQTPGSVRALATSSATGPSWPAREQPKVTGDLRDGSGPLQGVRVLDLGAVVAGAHAGGILANLGANVIKIEPTSGDPFRSDGALFLAYNRGKRGLGLDLKQPKGVALFYDLARQADVVLDNFRHGVRLRLGIDYASLKSINPRIISCSINAYGDTGDRAAAPGFDPLLQAESGMMAAQGGSDEPIYYTVPVNDAGTAAMAAFGVIAALNARERTGEGQEVLSSLMAQSLVFQLGEMVTYDGRPPSAIGGRDCIGVRALERFYACADGWLALVCETPAQASALAQALGVGIGDPDEALAAPCHGDLSMSIAEAFADRSRDSAVDALYSAGVAAAPARGWSELFDAEDLRGNGPTQSWRHPRVGQVISSRTYADFSRTPAGFRHVTPDLGQHTRALLNEFGVPPDRIADLFGAGAVFEQPS
jgi:crotonobetainyl-CoA:carnitine CoA-transferase CaiB-like acyl-CoA transferase